jgi:hypothetical protein
VWAESTLASFSDAAAASVTFAFNAESESLSQPMDANRNNGAESPRNSQLPPSKFKAKAKLKDLLSQNSLVSAAQSFTESQSCLN